MVELIAMNGDLQAQGVVDVYSSLIWERRFYESGYMELHAPATDNNIKLLKQKNVLLKEGAEESAVIEYVRTATGESGEEIIVVGYFLSRLLYGHVVKGKYSFSGSAEEAMRQLVAETVMNPEKDDYIPQVKLGEVKGIGAQVNCTIEFIDLEAALGRIAQLSGVGFILRAEPNSGELVFECFEGKDKSIEQTENPRVIFSEEYDTLLSSAEYTADRTVEVNAVTARYSGEYGEVNVFYNPYGKTGREKREICVTGDCVTVKTDEGVMLDVAATRAKLYGLAREQIKTATVNFSAAVSFTGNLQYKNSYNLGDIVTCEWHGMPLNRRIIKITEYYDANGTEIIPDMGEPFPVGE
ncbi:MAG: siphovirus ReqiPepy6 Gp37-like family protein [Ruminiclostridium sp.]